MSDQKPKLPTAALRFLRWFCPPSLYEGIEGDLLEKFEEDCVARGEKYARRRLMWNVIRFFRPGILLRNKFSMELHRIHMAKSHFKIAYRQMMKNKSFTLINVSGLAVAITACFLILQYVSFEMSYDQFHENKEQIYRVAYKQYENGDIKNTSAKNFAGLGYWMKEQFPEVVDYTRFWTVRANTGFLLMHNNRIFNEWGQVIMADSTFFKVFPSLLLRGSPDAALKNLNSLVLSERMAKKIFDGKDPVGQIISASEFNDMYVVTGILRDIPENSHFQADFVRLHDYTRDDPKGNWEGPWRLTYVTLDKNANPETLSRKVNARLRTMEREHPNTREVELTLQPITGIHLTSQLGDELRANGSMKLIYILLSIAAVILILAWINYVNIETSRFISRAREVGLRRIIGSTRYEMGFQFFVEFFCINVIAVGVAFVTLWLVIPYVAILSGIPMEHLQFGAPRVWMPALIVFIFGTFLAGTYPPIVLSRQSPVNTLKGRLTLAGTASGLKRGLVLFQFASSLTLISFVMVIYAQLNFMRNADKKIELGKVVAVRNPTAYSGQEESNKGKGGKENYNLLSTKLAQSPSISSVSSSSAIPGMEIGFQYVNQVKKNIGDPYNSARYKVLFVDYNFIPVYDLKLLAGRNYSKDNGEDENWGTLILNERAIRDLGFNTPEEAVDQEIYFMVVDDWDKYKIVGVVEDYHHEALKKEVHPTILFLNHNLGQQVYYSVRSNDTGTIREVLAYVEKTWKDIFPQKPFDYFFLDDFYDQQFKSELQFGRIFGWFAGVAVFVACLGVLGMTLFEASSRLKEISIRKVLGASVTGLLALLSVTHFRLLLISAVVVTPLIYYLGYEWLSTYPARIELSVTFLLLPFAMILVMVILTCGLQTLRAARTNPINHLRNE